MVILNFCCFQFMRHCKPYPALQHTPQLEVFRGRTFVSCGTLSPPKAGLTFTAHLYSSFNPHLLALK